MLRTIGLSPFHSPRRRSGSLLMLPLLALGAGCGEAGEPVNAGPSFEQFMVHVYREPETGVYIVDGDTPVSSVDDLERFYEQHVRGGVRHQGLAVNRLGQMDTKWDDTQKRALSYCVSMAFGSNYARVVSEMGQAAIAWQQVSHVNFIHDASQDGACNGANQAVLFDVRPTSGQPYLARAFFPNYTRADRNILIDASSFSVSPPWTLQGILRHELGHTLGFRHEHTRPEAGTCFEDNSWRALTPYDSASVMHYPQCNGSNTGDLTITQRDAEGAAVLYGRPAVYLADVTGDGRADAIVVNDDGITVRRSTGSAFGGNETWSFVPYFGVRGTYFADVTGDGRADAIVVNETGVTVRRSTGSAFGGNETWSSVPYYGVRGTYFADVTGDGRADAIVVNETGVTVRRSTGSAFGGNETWSSVPYYGVRGTYFADVTGDGRADAIVVNEIGVTVRRSTGNGFSGNETWSSVVYEGSRGIYFADVTGDGRADAIMINEDRVTVRRSTGSAFSGNESWTANPYFGDRGNAFADVTGDRRADAIVISSAAVVARRSTGANFSGNEIWSSAPYFGSR